MQKLLVLICLSALTAVIAVESSKSIAADRSGVSVSRDGVSAGGVSAGRDGVGVSGGGASVTASRDGASVRGGGSVTASRDGTSVRGGASVTASADDHSAGSVNARGEREYDDLASWMEDLGRWWSGSESGGDQAVSSGSAISNSSSVEQVSEATANSTDGEPAVAEASNSRVTRQNN